jgi:glyoxylase-like metal-dependent hydrolase (beta-lactamase superfamily II)
VNQGANAGRRLVTIATALVLGAACAADDPAARVVDSAAAALGGRSAIEAARTLVVEGEGEGFFLGQGPTPDAELPYRITGYRRAVDFVASRMRRDQVVTPLWAASNPAPQKDVAGFDGGIAFDVGPDGTAARASEADARLRAIELLHSPVGILRLALSPGAGVANYRRDGDRDVVDVRAAGSVLVLTADRATGLPVSVSSNTDYPGLGDVTIETEFGSYRAVDGSTLKLPALITSRIDTDVVEVIRVSRSLVNAGVADATAPAEVRSARADPPVPDVTVEELGAGVWRLAGGSHHSVLVELADHLVLVEAPENDARTFAVMARARALRPSKPLTHVVSTHHHFDHTGGIRAAVSEGLTIVAHERNVAFLEAIVGRPHAIAPDALAKTPRAMSSVSMLEQLTLGDPRQSVELYAAPGPHADTMIVAYLPRQRLLVEADLYTPPPPGVSGLAFPNAAALVRLVESRKLAVDRVVPLHRQVVPYIDLLSAAGRPSR